MKIYSQLYSQLKNYYFYFNIFSNGFLCGFKLKFVTKIFNIYKWIINLSYIFHAPIISVGSITDILIFVIWPKICFKVLLFSISSIRPLYKNFKFFNFFSEISFSSQKLITTSLKVSLSSPKTFVLLKLFTKIILNFSLFL